jgi:hypothetical protein
MKWLERALDWLIQQVRKHKRIDPHACCLACGNRLGSIRYLRSRVVHCCDVCGAFWSEYARINPQLWDFVARDEKQAEQSIEEFRKLFSPETKKES